MPPLFKEQVPPQVPNDSPIGHVMLKEFQASMTLLAIALKSQANRRDVALPNPIGGMSATRVREFLIMNPLMFYGFKYDED